MKLYNALKKYRDIISTLKLEPTGNIKQLELVMSNMSVPKNEKYLIDTMIDTYFSSLETLKSHLRFIKSILKRYNGKNGLSIKANVLNEALRLIMDLDCDMEYSIQFISQYRKPNSSNTLINLMSKQIKRFKNMINIDLKNSIEDIFNVEFFEPQKGDIMDERNFTMLDIYELTYIKPYGKDRPGLYVSECIVPGIKDKCTSQIYVKPEVYVEKKEVAKKYQNFTIVK